MQSACTRSFVRHAIHNIHHRRPIRHRRLGEVELLPRERLDGLRDQRVLAVVQHHAEFVPHAARRGSANARQETRRAEEGSHHARTNILRLSAAAIAAWSFSMRPVCLSASASHPSLCACLIPSSFIELLSTRFFRRSTWSPDSLSCRMNRSRRAIYRSRWPCMSM